MLKEKQQFLLLFLIAFTVTCIMVFVQFEDEIRTSLLPAEPDTLRTYILSEKQPEDLATLSPAEIRKYVQVLGYPETITTLNNIDPVACHDVAHIIGDYAFAEAGSVPASFNLCTEKCMSGCIHGALLAAVKGDVDYTSGQHGHVSLDDFATNIPNICNVETSDPTLEGTCIHGVGHALMSLSVDIDDGLKLCDEYADERKRYYCETGVFMEALLGEYNPYASSTNPLHPCDTYGTHPSACMRYQTHTIKELYEADIVSFCNSLEEPSLHIGCYHGLGRSMTMDLYVGIGSIRTCLETDIPEAQSSCVEGIGEVLHEYDFTIGKKICTELSDQPHLEYICTQALTDGLYSLEKDFTPYIGEAATRP